MASGRISKIMPQRGQNFCPCENKVNDIKILKLLAIVHMRPVSLVNRCANMRVRTLTSTSQSRPFLSSSLSTRSSPPAIRDSTPCSNVSCATSHPTWSQCRYWPPAIGLQAIPSCGNLLHPLVSDVQPHQSQSKGRRQPSNGCRLRPEDSQWNWWSSWRRPSTGRLPIP